MHRLQGSCRLVLLGLAAVGALLVLAALLAQPAEARTITVDDDGPADYDNLRDATNNASAGDTIFIYPGNYSRLSPKNDSVTYIGAARDEVIIQDISIGIDNNITIKNLSVKMNMLISMSKQIIFKNIRFFSGIQIGESRNIFIYNSTLIGNPKFVIDISYSSGVTLKNNSFTSEKYYEYTTYGVKGNHISNITIIGNSFYGRDYGIYLKDRYLIPGFDVISKNTFENHNIAIYYDTGINSEISYNVIKNSKIGISAVKANDIKGNEFKNVEIKYATLDGDEWDTLSGFGFSFSLLSFSIVMFLVRTTSRHRRRTRAPHSRS